jgi:hypothetical protein
MLKIRKPSSGPAGIEVPLENGEHPPKPASPTRRRWRQRRGEDEVSGDPQSSRPDAASQAAAEAIAAVPLLVQLGRTLASSGQLDIAAIAQHLERQRRALSTLRAEVEVLPTRKHLPAAARLCLRLATESAEASSALFEPLVRPATGAPHFGNIVNVGSVGGVMFSRDAPSSDPYVNYSRIDPASEPGRDLLDLGHELAETVKTKSPVVAVADPDDGLEVQVVRPGPLAELAERMVASTNDT